MTKCEIMITTTSCFVVDHFYHLYSSHMFKLCMYNNTSIHTHVFLLYKLKGGDFLSQFTAVGGRGGLSFCCLF